MTNIADNLIQVISVIAQHAISQADFDRTIQATILSCEDEVKGIYKIKYQDSVWRAHTADNNMTFKAGNSVYVLIPRNDTTQNKTIIGSATVSSSSTDDNDYISLQDTFIENGQNIIENSSQTFELCSYKNLTEERIIYSVQQSNNSLRINSNYENTYFHSSDYFILKADFRTRIPEEQRKAGNYGIAIYIRYKDSFNSGQYIEKKYVLDIDNMTGNPYLFESDNITQTVYFKIDKELFDKITKITIFSNSFLIQNNTQPNDIFISNIKIIGANVLTEEEREGNSLHFTYPNGYVFTSEHLDSAQKTVIAQVRINGKIITSQTSKIPFYWFKEDGRVKPGNEYYDQRGGSGWRCLNTFSASGFTFQPSQNTFIVTKRQIPIEKVNFKCVAIYQGFTISNTFSIVNTDSAYKISITTREDEGVFHAAEDTLHLICNFVNRNGTSAITSASSFVWSQIDEYGYFEILNGTDSVIQISAQNVINYNDYSCAVYQGDDYIGSASLRIFKTLKEKKEQRYILSLVNGIQLFNYDEEGESYYNNEDENENYSIPILSFTVLDSLNQQDVTQSVLGNGQVIWKIPKNNTLIIDKNTSENGTSSDEYIQYRRLRNIVYDIEKRYNVIKQNNTIKLTIIYNGSKLEAETNFLFVKEGDPGTNGTGMVCKIIAKKNNIRVTDWLTVNNSSFNWDNPLSVELWRDGQSIFSSNTSGTSLEGDPVTVTWDFLSLGDISWYSISSTGMVTKSFSPTISDFSFKKNKGWPANIIKVTVEYEGRKYYDNLPIVTVIGSNNLKLMKNSGFKYVVYSADGERPQYGNYYPFVLETSQTGLNFVWKAVGSYLAGTEIDNQNNILNVYKELTQKHLLLDTFRKSNEPLANVPEAYQNYYKPSTKYDGNTVTNALVVTTNSIAVHIPIHFMFNRYGQKWLNEWDGSSISIDNENNFILAPKIGAGTKDDQNGFTGIFMGAVSNRSQNFNEIGLFGYNSGVRTIFLDASTGMAIFGKAGAGQIILDPTNDTAQIRSGNYKTATSSSSGEGLLIDLTTPEIRFGSGNFLVNANGVLTAKEGYIGPWSLTNNYLYHGASLHPALGTSSSSSDEIYLGVDGVSFGNSLIYNTETGNFSLNVNSLSIKGQSINDIVNKDNKNLFSKNFLKLSNGVTELQGWHNYIYSARFQKTVANKYFYISIGNLKLQKDIVYTLSFYFQKCVEFDDTANNYLKNVSIGKNYINVQRIILDNEQIDSAINPIPLQNNVFVHYMKVTFEPKNTETGNLVIYFNFNDTTNPVDISIFKIMVQQSHEASEWVPSGNDSIDDISNLQDSLHGVDSKAEFAITAAGTANRVAEQALADAAAAAKVAINYLWYDASNGLIIYDGTDQIEDSSLEGLTSANIRMTASGTAIYKGKQKLADYGATTIFYNSNNEAVTLINQYGMHINKGTITLGNKFYADSDGSLVLGTSLDYNASTDVLTLKVKNIQVDSLSIQGTDINQMLNKDSKNLFSKSFLLKSSGVTELADWDNYAYVARFSSLISATYFYIRMSDLGLEKDAVYTLSFDFAKTTTYSSGSDNYLTNISPYYNTSIIPTSITIDGVNKLQEMFNSNYYLISLTNNTSSRKFVMTFKVSNNTDYLYIYFNRSDTSHNVDIRISHIMIEKNSEATNWQASGTDFANDVSGLSNRVSYVSSRAEQGISAAEQAALDAAAAAKIANNYIWYDSLNGVVIYDGTGQSISDSSLSNLTTANVRIKGSGMGVYSGNTQLALYGSSVIFYDGQGTAAANQVTVINQQGMHIKKGTITLGTNKFYADSNGSLTLGANSLVYNATNDTLSLNVSSLSVAGDPFESYLSNISGKNLFSRSFLKTNSGVSTVATWDGYTYVARFSNTTGYKYLSIKMEDLELQEGQTYTLYFQCRRTTTYTAAGDNNHLVNMSPYYDNSITITEIYQNKTNKTRVFSENNNILPLSNNNNLYKIAVTFKVNSITQGYKQLFIYFNKGDTTYKVDVEISNIMVEKNFRASGWEPSAADALLDVQEARKGASNYIWYDGTHGMVIYDGSTSKITSSNLTELTGANLRLKNSEISFYYGINTKLATYASSSITFYDGTGTASSNIACQIGINGLEIKKGTITLGSNFSVSETGVMKALQGTISNFSITSRYLHYDFTENNKEYKFYLYSTTENNTYKKALSLTVGGENVFYLNFSGSIFTKADIHLENPGALKYRVSSNGSVISYNLISITEDGLSVQVGDTRKLRTLQFQMYSNNSYVSYVQPSTNKITDLGSTSHYWRTVYSVNFYTPDGYLTGSDEKYKNILGNLNEYKELFMNLEPIQYIWKEEENKDNVKIHFGIGARKTKQLINKYSAYKNLAFIHSENDSYSVSYSQLLMLTVPIVQQHEQKIIQLKDRVSLLEKEIQKLKGERKYNVKKIKSQ